MGFDELHGLVGLQRHRAARAHEGIGGSGLVEIDPLHGGAARMTGQGQCAAAGRSHGGAGIKIDTFIRGGGARALTSQGDVTIHTADCGIGPGQVDAPVTAGAGAGLSGQADRAGAAGTHGGGRAHDNTGIAGAAALRGAGQIDGAVNTADGGARAGKVERIVDIGSGPAGTGQGHCAGS